MGKPAAVDWTEIKRLVKTEGLSLSAAGKIAGIAHTTIRRHQDRHPEFWGDAVGADIVNQVIEPEPPPPPVPAPRQPSAATRQLHTTEQALLEEHRLDLQALAEMLRDNRVEVAAGQGTLARIDRRMTAAIQERNTARANRSQFSPADMERLEVLVETLESQRRHTIDRLSQLNSLVSLIQRQASTLIAVQDGQRRAHGVSDTNNRPQVQLLQIIQEIKGGGQASNIINTIRQEAADRGQPIGR